MCDSVNHTRFPKEDHLPNWERRDNKVTKGDRVEACFYGTFELEVGFDVDRAAHRNIISTVKPTRGTNVSNLFYFGMTLWCLIAVCLLASIQQYLSDKYLLLYVQSWIPDDGRKDRPRHVEWICLTNTCCCMYSLEFLMMGGKTVRGM